MNVGNQEKQAGCEWTNIFFFPSHPRPERNPCDVCDLLTPSSEISQVDIIKRQEHLKAVRASNWQSSGAWSPNQEKCFFFCSLPKRVYRCMFKAHSTSLERTAVWLGWGVGEGVIFLNVLKFSNYFCIKTGLFGQIHLDSCSCQCTVEVKKGDPSRHAKLWQIEDRSCWISWGTLSRFYRRWLDGRLICL